jgi:Lrp/AsnC family transcriptional regulator, leucine-responsive regulatory protein
VADLDEIDLDLLILLQRDARRTLRELGDAVSLSPSAVHRRIARYQLEGRDRARGGARCSTG